MMILQKFGLQGFEGFQAFLNLNPNDSSKGKAATGNPPYNVAAPFATPKATMSLVP